MQRLADEGLDGLAELIRELVNGAKQIERERHLNAKPYKGSEGRHGHAHGCKPKTVKTRVGAITFDIPQVREGG